MYIKTFYKKILKYINTTKPWILNNYYKIPNSKLQSEKKNETMYIFIASASGNPHLDSDKADLKQLSTGLKLLSRPFHAAALL